LVAIIAAAPKIGGIRRMLSHKTSLPVLLAILTGAVSASGGNAKVSGELSSQPCLEDRKIIEAAMSLGSADSFGIASGLFVEDSARAGVELTAFEENQSFVYAVGSVTPPVVSSTRNSRQESHARLTRRLIILKPATFIVDDEFRDVTPNKPVDWCLSSLDTPKISMRGSRVGSDHGELYWQTLLPQKFASRVAVVARKTGGSTNQVIETATQSSPDGVRFIHIFGFQDRGSRVPSARTTLTASEDEIVLTVTSEGKVFRLALPPPDVGAGTIAISSQSGKSVLENRPLASGILPHGPEGTRLLDLWDSDYRGSKPPLWDIGRPANELVKLVNEGAIRRCRAVDLCCGSGTDAIFLASKGFDVTGIDISPTALSQARRKAAAAGVHVHWLYADVLAPPNLVPFDFIYDRGCYHVVRNQNLAAYLETLRLLSHPGTRFLLLASRSAETEANTANSGVSEEEIRFDFLRLFDLESLKGITLESNKKGGTEPPGWSALFKRKE
jgi:methyl halide transferase